jgi:hypothetical protein
MGGSGTSVGSRLSTVSALPLARARSRRATRSAHLRDRTGAGRGDGHRDGRVPLGSRLDCARCEDSNRQGPRAQSRPVRCSCRTCAAGLYTIRADAVAAKGLPATFDPHFVGPGTTGRAGCRSRLPLHCGDAVQNLDNPFTRPRPRCMTRSGSSGSHPPVLGASSEQPVGSRPAGVADTATGGRPMGGAPTPPCGTERCGGARLPGDRRFCSSFSVPKFIHCARQWVARSG